MDGCRPYRIGAPPYGTGNRPYVVGADHT